MNIQNDRASVSKYANYAKWIIWETTFEWHSGIFTYVEGNKISNLRYANDIILLDGSGEEIFNLMTRVNRIRNDKGIKINLKGLRIYSNFNQPLQCMKFCIRSLAKCVKNSIQLPPG